MHGRRIMGRKMQLDAALLRHCARVNERLAPYRVGQVGRNGVDVADARLHDGAGAIHAGEIAAGQSGAIERDAILDLSILRYRPY